MTEKTNKSAAEKEPTPEELAKMRLKMVAYYEEEIPLLKQQAEYERLLAEIEESRAKRISFNMRIAQMLAPPAPSQEPESESNLTNRKLKTS